MRVRELLMAGAGFPLALLGGCGDGGGTTSVASTPVVSASAPSPAPVAVVVPTTVNYDTAEYRRSNAAVQAQAIAAYNAGATGAGVTVGVIDSGIATANSEFAGRISAASRDYAGTRGIEDVGGHGTAVSSILLGARNDSGVSGVAFDATLLALRTDTPGSCSAGSMGSDSNGCTHADSAIAAALDGAVAARARVVNISLGGSPANSTLRAAINRATAAGTIIVIAAGNDGVKNPTAAVDPDMLAQIALDPVARGLVIIAGSVDASSNLADFSNKAGIGAAYYLTALGVRVRGIDNTGTAYLFSGTSFSTPVIAGAAALLAQAFPNLTSAQIVSLLYRSANDLGAGGVDSVYGNGELNLARAFQPQGATSLAGSAVPVSLTSNATLGSAMGDAGQGGLSAGITDGYGRDYTVNLAGTIARAAPQPALARALAVGTRSLSATGSRTSFALAIDERGAQPQALMLGRSDAGQVRVLAAAVAMKLSGSARLGIGIGRGAEGLTVSSTDGRTPAFLVGDHDLDRAPVGAFAVRQRLGGIGLTLSADSGDLRLWQTTRIDARLANKRRFPYAQLSAAIDGERGPFAASLKLARLSETATVLGSRFDPAFGGSGATSWFGDAAIALTPATGWRIGATLRRGVTRVSANGVRSGSTLASQSLSADVARTDVWTRGDTLALRYAEPLRVTGGALMLALPGSPPQSLALAPSGHERDVEAAYTRPLGTGWLTANAYLRRQAGNFRTAPDDLGAAVRWSTGF